MSFVLPTDDNGNPIAALGFDYRGTQQIAVDTESKRNAQPIASYTALVTIIATGPCYFEIGDASVTATTNGSAFLFPGQYLDIPLRQGERYIAFISTDACTAYVMSRI
ncbi:hypothetical protein SAMN07250955_101333 [Arboricoccus pini]|uniref:Uncharacterized protein n=1 Tax=Arboricoccus pini TaxID=1963835 RepID=A0A212Q1Q0_9PROT|nr:hypothetical protein [Arboricoccus pini]SNB53088.1 hypothetical protein SAMN07250955_101333 [Arboricoccus pini]